jgi:hypothetical protein
MELENDALASGGDDVRADLERALANPSPETVETEPTPETSAPEPEAAPVEAEPQAAAESSDTRQRDEKGRFASKPADPTPTEAAPQQQAQPKPAEKPADYIPPPAHWADAEKTINWQRLPKPVQQAIAKREADISEMERGFSGVAQVLAPRAQRLAATYGTPEQGLNTLFQLSDYAERDPYGFVGFFMQQRGLDPRRLFQQPSGQQPPQGAAPVNATGQQGPDYQTLLQRLHALESQQSQASEQAYLDQIEAFARDPNRPHFNAVRNEMAALLQSKAAATLEEAYEKATWANPMIRQELQSKEIERLEAERKAKADAARKAQQTNLNGSAPIGLVAAATPGSIEDDLRSAMQAHAGRV